MKNKKIAFAVVISVVVVALSGVACGKKEAPKAENSSRRDGAAVSGGGDEDLLLVGGDPDAELGSTKGPDAKQKPAETLVGDVSNSPVSDSVDEVRTMTISEAVVIDAGDRDAFYNDAEYKNVVPTDAASFPGDIDETKLGEIPTKYDSRNVDGKSFVTGVRDQGYSYLCWAFASAGAMETDILKHYPEYRSSELDLSEKHIAYYNVHKAVGSYGGNIDEDYRELVNSENEDGAWVVDNDTGYIAMGGVTNYCISLLTSWKGPVFDKGTDSFKSIYGSKYIFNDNTDKPSEAYASEFHVQDVNQVRGSYDNNALIKQMVMEHAGATIGVNSDEGFWNKNHGNLYSHFGGELPPTANHEVLIIGWDDDYSASNFSAKPEGDGAWLCKNSWGDKTGSDGFFYLSYYDETAAVSNAAAYSVKAKNDERYYDNNYQVGGFITNEISALEDTKNTVTAYTDSSNPYGVLYTSIGDEELDAIGLMSLDAYRQYEVSIFLNPVEGDGELSLKDLGKPVLTQKISSVSGGFHTYDLDEKIDLKAGDNFFILIKPHTPGKLAFETAGDVTYEKNYDEWNNLTGNIHNSNSASGKSYYISDDGKALNCQKDKDFFIKAYTKNK